MTSMKPCAALDSQATARRWLQSELDTEQVSPAFQGHGFRLGNLGCLLSQHLHCEVVDEIPLCLIPGTSPILLGMTHLRGRILPVFDLHLAITQQHSQTHSRFLFVDAQTDGFAIAIKELPSRKQFQDAQRMHEISGIDTSVQPFCQQVFYDDCLWLDLDYKALFTQLTQRMLAAG